ncbi:MAG: ATP-binding protein [Dehalococcoidia bacterium]
MTPKESHTNKLKKYRLQKSDEYARVIMSPPRKVSLYSVIPYPGVVMIMGDIRTGKTGLAHEIANEIHRRRKLPAILHMPRMDEKQRKALQRIVPSWMKVTTKQGQWQDRVVVIYDEAAQSAHARRSQSGDAVELDELLAIAGQREQLILFISHYSRKLDLNVCTAVHRIIWKRPTYAHQLWERDEMADFTTKAYDFFRAINGPVAQKKACLVLDMENFAFLQCNNKLPEWWSDKLSRIFKDIQIQGVRI